MTTDITFLRSVVSAALMFVICGGAGGAEPLRLEFTSQRPEGARVYSSEAGTPWGTLWVVDGATVTLQAESGRDTRLRASGLRWGQVEDVPAEVDAVQVTPRVDGERVTLDISLYRRDRENSISSSTTTAGRLGEWLQVTGPAQRGAGKVFSSRPSLRRVPALYIRVSAAGENP